MFFNRKFQVLGLAAVLAVFASSDLMAQRGGFGGFGSQVNSLSLLMQEGVQKELELVDEQVEKIQQAQTEAREAMREMFREVGSEIRDMAPEDRAAKFKEIQAEMGKITADIEKEAMTELLPHQVSRLKQLLVQAQTRRNGGATSGRISSALVEELGLTDEQQEELKLKAEEVGKKMNEKIAKLKKQAQDEVFSSVLTKEQFAQFQEMVGDSYNFDESQGQQGQQRRGGGDRGGDGRGGGRGGDRDN
jgi:hypothetical protein